MKKNLPEQHRIKTGQYASKAGTPEGIFLIPCAQPRPRFLHYLVIASAKGGWESVSVSIYDTRKNEPSKFIPTWPDMCFIKDLFFRETEHAVQIHPAKELYAPKNNRVLTIWCCKTPPPFEGFPMPHPLIAGLAGWELGEEGKRILKKTQDETPMLEKEGEGEHVSKEIVKSTRKKKIITEI